MGHMLVFDVNETLLDVAALRPRFEDAFGTADVLPVWFAQLLRSAHVLTLTGRYEDFGTVARHALALVAAARGLILPETAVEAIIAGMLSLPPHPEAYDALDALREAGFRLATLTNSSAVGQQMQLDNAGLSTLFERMLSVEAVGQFKPAPATYQYAAAELGVSVGELRMVAAHSWDTTGAIRAGCKAAFVARPGMALGPLDETPDIVGSNLLAVARQIIDTDLPR